MTKNTIALLPLGAYEYHGEHLPFDTDSIIAQSIAEKLIERGHKNLHILPCEPYGYSIEHNHHEKTHSLGYEEAIKRWIAIAEECYHQNIKKILFLNAHGGNSPLLTIVTTELRAKFSMLAVATSWRRFPLPSCIEAQTEKDYDIHGGFLETSLMLALKNSVVSMDRAENFLNKQKEFIKTYHYLRAYGGSNFGWMMTDLNMKGAAGNALTASYEAGVTLLESIIDNLILLLKDMEAFDLELFR